MQAATRTAKYTSITSTASGLASSCIFVPHGGAPLIISAPDWSASKKVTLYGGYDPNLAASFEPLLSQADFDTLIEVLKSGCVAVIGGIYLSFALTNPGTGATITLVEPNFTYAP